MADLFLSYSPKDAATAHQIAQELERRGSAIFYQRPDELDNDNSLHLDQEMDQASWVIVLWSPNALQDGRITYEAMHARDKNNLLSVQIAPNSIPAEFNNDHSPDHINYQNQLSAIIQQTLYPESVPAETVPEARSTDTAPENTVQGTAQQEASPETSQSDVSTDAGQQQPAKTGNSAATMAQNAPQKTVGQETASQAVPDQVASQNTMPNNQQQVAHTTPAENAPTQHVQTDQQQTTPQQRTVSPRQDLQQRLAEKTQGVTAVNTAAGQNANKIGHSPASQQSSAQTVPQETASAPQRRDLPPIKGQAAGTQQAVNKSQVFTPQETGISPAIAATTKTSKIVPVALISAGAVLLGSVGAGYWYLANTPAQSDIVHKASVSKPKIIRKEKSPAKVAVRQVEKPKMVATLATPRIIAPAPKTTAPKEVSTQNDPLLDQILQTIPKPQKAVVKTGEDASARVFKASATRGERFVAQCQGCHSFNRNGKNLSGPNLYGVMNQLIGSERTFNYSDTLRSMGAIGEVWNKEQLDCYLKNPAVCMPGTKMTFNGIKSSKKRADIIAYLTKLKQ